MTIEELGARAGLTTRTIRSYQTIGMLPAPRKVGRVGYYNDEHLDRLAAIGRLMHRGFSLAAIAALFHAYEQGHTLGDVLGLGARDHDPPDHGRSDHAGERGAASSAAGAHRAAPMSVPPDGVIDLR